MKHIRSSAARRRRWARLIEREKQKVDRSDSFSADKLHSSHVITRSVQNIANPIMREILLGD